tara:strand:+ start:315 stop:488 length:174 start_codon:yes stop_codon:yes gene_type:complete
MNPHFNKKNKNNMQSRQSIELHIEKLKETRVSKTLGVKRILEDTISYWEDRLKQCKD